MSFYQEFNDVVAAVLPNLNVLPANTKKVMSLSLCLAYSQHKTPSL